jgi:nitrile hydratase accessory protein
VSAALAPLDVEGVAAPPRANGELVFSAPWESRAFGMAMALREGGVFTWDEFRACLVARINESVQNPPKGECWSYYQCWQRALEDIVVARSLVPASGIVKRAAELIDRPQGHDHAHDHDHDHEH